MNPPVVDARLADETAERVRRSHAQAIKAMQAHPALGLRVIANVELKDTINTFVAHGLGRAPIWVGISCPRGALGNGIVRDVTNGRTPGLFAGGADVSHVIVLRADDYAATIVVDVLVL